MDPVETAVTAADAQSLTPEQVKVLGYDAFHAMAGVDKNATLAEPFVWESVREQVANILSVPAIECEDGQVL